MYNPNNTVTKINIEIFSPIGRGSPGGLQGIGHGGWALATYP
jgi:hypothetical protein|nr:hypothetical protein [uncultured Flavobacterium sp.]